MLVKIYVFIVFLTLLSFQTVISQELTPLDITEKFFGPDGFKEKRQYLCCEMKEYILEDSTYGQYIYPYVTRSYELIEMNDSYAVTSILYVDSVFKTNLYAYFKKEDTWKLEGVRALALTGIAGMLLMMHDSLSQDSIEAIKKINPDYEFSIENIRLELSSDKEIIEYFRKNKDKFDELLNYYISHNYQQQDDSIAKNDEQLQRLIKEALLRSIRSCERTDSSICFLIGGMLDNMVGYMYQPDSDKVPVINKSNYIIIREIGDGWYLYKTT